MQYVGTAHVLKSTLMTRLMESILTSSLDAVGEYLRTRVATRLGVTPKNTAPC